MARFIVKRSSDAATLTKVRHAIMIRLQKQCRTHKNDRVGAHQRKKGVANSASLPSLPGDTAPHPSFQLICPPFSAKIKDQNTAKRKFKTVQKECHSNTKESANNNTPSRKRTE